jgi:hypothetical protein
MSLPSFEYPPGGSSNGPFGGAFRARSPSVASHRGAASCPVGGPHGSALHVRFPECSPSVASHRGAVACTVEAFLAVPYMCARHLSHCIMVPRCSRSGGLSPALCICARLLLRRIVAPCHAQSAVLSVVPCMCTHLRCIVSQQHIVSGRGMRSPPLCRLATHVVLVPASTQSTASSSPARLKELQPQNPTHQSVGRKAKMEVGSKGAREPTYSWAIGCLRHRCRRRTWSGAGVGVGSMRQGADAGATWRVLVMIGMRSLLCLSPHRCICEHFRPQEGYIMG